MIELKVKRLSPSAMVPTRAHLTDAGMDLYVHRLNLSQGICTIHTGIAVAIPAGYVGMLFPRSSIFKKDLRMANCVGIIDSGYRGEVCLKLDMIGSDIYEVYDRCGQLIVMPYPQVTVVEVDELGVTDRNLGGFGSSGK